MYFALLSKSLRPLRGCRSVVSILSGIAIILLVVSMCCAETKVFRIGVLTPGINYAPVLKGLQDGLAKYGLKEGNNVTYIVEDTKGSTSDLPQRMAKLLAAKPDIIYTVGTASATAAKQATATIPIVFAWVGDPVGAGLIPNYASSKSNLTGVTTYTPALTGKRLEVLLDVLPKAKRILTIVTSTENIAQSTFQQLEEGAHKLGVQLVRRDAASREDIVGAIQKTPRGSVDAIFYISSVLMKANIDVLIKKSFEDRVPVAVFEDSLVEAGALYSYGSDFGQAGMQSAELVEKVIRGSKPGEIIVETPNKFFLAINLLTAKKLGIKVPRSVMERADRIIE